MRESCYPLNSREMLCLPSICQIPAAHICLLLINLFFYFYFFFVFYLSFINLFFEPIHVAAEDWKIFYILPQHEWLNWICKILPELFLDHSLSWRWNFFFLDWSFQDVLREWIDLQVNDTFLAFLLYFKKMKFYYYSVILVFLLNLDVLEFWLYFSPALLWIFNTS